MTSEASGEGTGSEVACRALLGTGSLSWALGSDPAAGQLRGVWACSLPPLWTLATLVPEPASKTAVYVTLGPKTRGWQGTVEGQQAQKGTWRGLEMERK